MTNSDQEILQLAQRIQHLSQNGPGQASVSETVLSVRLAKIQELANALLPRLEARTASR